MTATLYRFYAEFTPRRGGSDHVAVWAVSPQAAAAHERLMYQPTSRARPGFTIDPIPDAVRINGGDIRLLTRDEQRQWTSPTPQLAAE